MAGITDAVERLAARPDVPSHWDEVVTLFWPFVRTLALQRTTQFADAEDLSQDAFVRLYRAWTLERIEIRDAASLRAMLAVIVRCLAIDRHRHRQRDRRDARRLAPTGADIDPADSHSHVRETEILDVVSNVCRSLNPLEQQMMELRLQDYEIGEIAKKFRCSSRTVNRKLRRIKALLSQHFPELVGEVEN